LALRRLAPQGHPDFVRPRRGRLMKGAGGNDEQKLVERVAAGDGAAFEELTHAYRNYVPKIIRDCAHGACDADLLDISQEVFMRLWLVIRGGRLRQGSSVRPLLARIAVNCSITWGRRR